jgi:ABC-type Co2+ transport system permease subunit
MKKLIYLLVGLLLIACSEDTATETGNCFGDQVIYLAENGITIKACDQANVGDTGVIGGYYLYRSR